MDMTLNEAYAILNINSNIDTQSVKNAYRKAMKSYHGKDKEMVRKINAAFNVVFEDIENKNKLDAEIRKQQEAARAKAKAKAQEQIMRQEEKKQAIEREKVRRIKKIYSDLRQSSLFRNEDMSLEYFIDNINKADCEKWMSIHYYAYMIYTCKEKYIKEYGDNEVKKNASIDKIISFTELHPNPIIQRKIQAYRAILNQRYGNIGNACDFVCKTFMEDILYLSKCYDFDEDSILRYLIGDREYQENMFEQAEKKIAGYYKIAKYIANKNECKREIEEKEFLDVRSLKYQTDIKRMKDIESYVNRVYIFKDDGTIGINNDNISRTEYQKAREWFAVVKTNNLGKIDHSTIIVYMNYIAGCMYFIYDKIPHPEFNPNVSPEKLLDIAKVIGTIEKYYLLAQEDGVTEAYQTYLKICNKKEYKNQNMSQILSELIKLNKKRKIINKYYLHSYYSLEELALMDREKINLLYKRAVSFKVEIEGYIKSRPDKKDLVEIYLKKLKDNKRFAPLFNEDVTFIEIMQYLEVKQYELNSIIGNKPSLEKFIFMNGQDIIQLKEKPIYDAKKKFIREHSNDYEYSELNEMNNKEIDALYRKTIIDFLNKNLTRYKTNPLTFASFGRLDKETIDKLIKDAEDEMITNIIVKEIINGYNKISLEEVRRTTPMMRIQILKEIRDNKRRGGVNE